MATVNIVPFIRAIVHWADLMSGLMIEVHHTMSPHDRAHLRLRLKELKEKGREIEFTLGFDDQADQAPAEGPDHGDA